MPENTLEQLPMQFYSTNGKAPDADARTAILTGLAPDKGLYMPYTIPSFSQDILDTCNDMSYPELASTLIYPFLTGSISQSDLLRICKDAYTFPIPFETLDESHTLLHLDRGPTCAFKDFAAQFMARIIEYYLTESDEEMCILTATSGDTGSAVAHAFHQNSRVRVVVLFPQNEVTQRQRALMTTLGDNISAIAVDGTFDDCQALVKHAFVDQELKDLKLSSANSINIARLIPQSVYYMYAWLHLPHPLTVCVPSGNFGNLMGGLFAKDMGANFKRFIVAVNENHEFATFYHTHEYHKIVPSRNCISNAMNVGHPSNLARLIALYGGQMDEDGILHKEPDYSALSKDMWAISVTDEQTSHEIKRIYDTYNTQIEPHGAVGTCAVEYYRKETGDTRHTVTLETAHPAKFPEIVQRVTGIAPPLPDSMRTALESKEDFHTMPASYPALTDYLRSMQ